VRNREPSSPTDFQFFSDTAAPSPPGFDVTPRGETVQRTFTADEIDSIKRGLGQAKDLARSALAVAEQVLELHRQGLGPVAIARQLGVGRKSAARLLARLVG
jgi:hypothetical protein